MVFAGSQHHSSANALRQSLELLRTCAGQDYRDVAPLGLAAQLLEQPLPAYVAVAYVDDEQVCPDGL
jgi:hypothetical protein